MNNKKEPMFHIVKNSNPGISHVMAVKFTSILLALLVCGIITTMLTGLNPLAVYISFLNGAFGSTRRIWITFQDTAVLMIISLALTPAFRMKFWNVGGEGQMLMGALASSAVMIELGGKIPEAFLLIIMLILSVLAGALWAFVPAICKVKWRTNETLSTLMMNYIATQIVAFFTIFWEVPKGSGKIGIINQNTGSGWLPNVFGSKYAFVIILALFFTLVLHLYLYDTKQGYEISVVGESENTARYVGIKVERVMIRTMFISGAILGIVGMVLSAGINHTLTASIAGGQGFTGVMVAWMAKLNPDIILAISLLITVLKRGAGEISTAYMLNESFADILTGIIIFFLIGSEFFISYRISFRKKGDK